MVYTKEDLKIMQSWDLARKIQVTQTRIIEWYQYYQGKVYVSFSGGKDSTVLLDLARRIYPDIEAVFVDTGLEYPEIRQFVKSIENVTWLKPIMSFPEVIKKYGYPIISKEVAFNIHYARQESSWAINCLKGLNNDGTYSKFKQRFIKWAYLLLAPFKISHKCCEYLKEKPLDNYGKLIGSKAIIGTMADESNRRKDAYLKVGCNAFKKKRPTSQPMGFWTEQDVLHYIKDFKIPYSSIYGEIVEFNEQINMFETKLKTTGEQRTGCMFCMFGCHLDKENKFQRMAKTHPKQYDYCINKLGCGKVLDYINVKY